MALSSTANLSLALASNNRSSGGYFFAQNIALRDKDIVLVANAETAQIQKAMTLLRAFTGAYFDISKGAAFYVPTSN